MPNFLLLEWHWVDWPHWHDLVQADPRLIQVPEGLVLELNEAAAQEYARPDRPFFE